MHTTFIQNVNCLHVVCVHLIDTYNIQHMCRMYTVYMLHVYTVYMLYVYTEYTNCVHNYVLSR